MKPSIEATDPSPPVRSRTWGVPPNIFFLGLVSFLTDVSSEMIFTLVPLFLKNILGVKTLTIGLIMGVTEGMESVLKILSGWLSDRLRKRKPFALLGYGLSTLAKPFMYLATAWGTVLGVRFVDRVGKGIRTSPRDTLVADSAPAEEMGKSFGLHRAMDTAGAVLGLVIAALIIFLHQPETRELTLATYHLLVLVGVVPAVLAFLILWFFVKERRREVSPNIDSSQGETTIMPKKTLNLGLEPQVQGFLRHNGRFHPGQLERRFPYIARCRHGVLHLSYPLDADLIQRCLCYRLTSSRRAI